MELAVRAGGGKRVCEGGRLNTGRPRNRPVGKDEGPCSPCTRCVCSTTEPLGVGVGVWDSQQRNETHIWIHADDGGDGGALWAQTQGRL